MVLYGNMFFGCDDAAAQPHSPEIALTTGCHVPRMELNSHDRENLNLRFTTHFAHLFQPLRQVHSQRIVFFIALTTGTADQHLPFGAGQCPTSPSQAICEDCKNLLRQRAKANYPGHVDHLEVNMVNTDSTMHTSVVKFGILTKTLVSQLKAPTFV